MSQFNGSNSQSRRRIAEQAVAAFGSRIPVDGDRIAEAQIVVTEEATWE
jgi:hypothetical protein